jgi:predicted nucleotidyltransferase
MLKNLFTSEVRILLLSRFLMNEDREFYLRQLSSHFNLSPRHVSLELKNLQNIGIINKRIAGNLHYYNINRRHPLFKELKSIFLKTIGLKDVILRYLNGYNERIQYAFIYGSMARGDAASDSDIDLMMIGDISSRQISAEMIEAGNELQREINFSIFSLEEFKSRLRKKDHFVSSLMNGEKVFVIGDANELERMVQ